ncbi:MAG: hypothetical protein K0R11_1127 [Acidimicrobiales bacterium]|nr:hypothetical protein [Acidimicrobiales bacterium]
MQDRGWRARRGVVAVVGVVAALLVGTVGAPPASAAPVGPFPSAETFVAQSYRDLTGRDPGLDQLLLGVAAASAGGTAPAELQAKLVSSAPSRGVVFPVVRLYEAYFGRGPDTGGLAFWTGAIRSGTPSAAVSDAFAASPEFTARYGALSNGAFVDRVYRNVLGRAPDAGGAAFWTGVLDTGQANRGQVMLGFSDSKEYARKLKSVVRVAASYFGMLRRVPTGAEYDSGVALLEGGAPLRSLLGQLLSSTAYGNRIRGICTASYLDFCLPPPPPDLTCESALVAGRTNFRVTGADPHDLDGDGDGLGCEPPKTTPPPPPPPTGGVINVYNDPHHQLGIRDVLPFSTAHQDPTPAKRVRVKNVGTGNLVVGNVHVVGSSAFRIVNSATSFTLAPQQETQVFVEYRPGPVPGTGKGEQHTASLFFDSNDAGQPRDEVFLRGWHAREYENNVEPSRQQIVDAIGFETNVGTNLPRDDVNTGEEMRGSGYFRKAGGGPVVLYPLARFSTRTIGTTGETRWFSQGTIPTTPSTWHHLYAFPGCGCADPTIGSGGENQKLVPAPNGPVTFNPPGNFGIGVRASGENLWSVDSLNGEGAAHAFRFWPAKDRDGTVIPNTGIVGNDLGSSPEALLTKNWDYQDFMWVLSNATPV